MNMNSKSEEGNRLFSDSDNHKEANMNKVEDVIEDQHLLTLNKKLKTLQNEYDTLLQNYNQEKLINTNSIRDPAFFKVKKNKISSDFYYMTRYGVIRPYKKNMKHNMKDLINKNTYINPFHTRHETCKDKGWNIIDINSVDEIKGKMGTNMYDFSPCGYEGKNVAVKKNDSSKISKVGFVTEGGILRPYDNNNHDDNGNNCPVDVVFISDKLWKQFEIGETIKKDDVCFQEEGHSKQLKMKIMNKEKQIKTLHDEIYNYIKGIYKKNNNVEDSNLESKIKEISELYKKTTNLNTNLSNVDAFFDNSIMKESYYWIRLLMYVGLTLIILTGVYFVSRPIKTAIQNITNTNINTNTSKRSNANVIKSTNNRINGNNNTTTTSNRNRNININTNTTTTNNGNNNINTNINTTTNNGNNTNINTTTTTTTSNNGNRNRNRNRNRNKNRGNN